MKWVIYMRARFKKTKGTPNVMARILHAASFNQNHTKSNGPANNYNLFFNLILDS